MTKKSKDILILGLNYDQLEYIKIIRSYGYIIYGVDKNSKAPGKKYCDYFLNKSYTDIDEILYFLKVKKFSNDGLFFTASSQISFLSLGLISKKLKKNFIDPKIIHRCIDKSKMNKFFKKIGIPIPKTKYFYGRKITVENNKEYFLKSDYGKTPNYLYFIKNGKVPKLPKKDDFYRNCFLLQEKIIGNHFRVNYLKNKFFVFKKINDNISIPSSNLPFFDKKIKNKIKFFIKENKLKNFLIKFDIIINEKNWYVLDIGFDPPKRLEKIMIYKNKNFFKAYVNNWLNKENLFKNLSLKRYGNLIIKFYKSGKSKIFEK